MDIILLSETWFTEEKKYSNPGMEMIRKDRTQTIGGGVAIGIRYGINYETLKLDKDIFKTSKLEIIAIKLTKILY